MIKKCVVLGISMLFLVSDIFAQSQNNTNLRNQYLGVRYKDYRELRELTKVNSNMINLHYGIALMKKEDKHFLFLSKFENSENYSDDFQLRVIDIKEIPKFNEFYHCVSVKGCSQNGKNDPTLFALAVIEPQKYLTKIVKVWKLDKPTGKILDYTSSGVKCINYSQLAFVSESSWQSSGGGLLLATERFYTGCRLSERRLASFFMLKKTQRLISSNQ